MKFIFTRSSSEIEKFISIDAESFFSCSITSLIEERLCSVINVFIKELLANSNSFISFLYDAK